MSDNYVTILDELAEFSEEEQQRFIDYFQRHPLPPPTEVRQTDYHPNDYFPSSHALPEDLLPANSNVHVRVTTTKRH